MGDIGDADAKRKRLKADLVLALRRVEQEARLLPEQAQLVLLCLQDVWSEIRKDCQQLLNISCVNLSIACINELFDAIAEQFKDAKAWQSIHGLLLGVSAIGQRIAQADDSETENVRAQTARRLCLESLNSSSLPIRDAARHCLTTLDCAARPGHVAEILSRLGHSSDVDAEKEGGATGAEKAEKQKNATMTPYYIDGLLSCLADSLSVVSIMQLSESKSSSSSATSSAPIDALGTVRCVEAYMGHASSTVRQVACKVYYRLVEQLVEHVATSMNEACVGSGDSDGNSNSNSISISNSNGGVEEATASFESLAHCCEWMSNRLAFSDTTVTAGDCPGSVEGTPSRCADGSSGRSQKGGGITSGLWYEVESCLFISELILQHVVYGYFDAGGGASVGNCTSNKIITSSADNSFVESPAIPPVTAATVMQSFMSRVGKPLRCNYKHYVFSTQFEIRRMSVQILPIFVKFCSISSEGKIKRLDDIFDSGNKLSFDENPSKSNGVAEGANNTDSMQYFAELLGKSVLEANPPADGIALSCSDNNAVKPEETCAQLVVCRWLIEKSKFLQLICEALACSKLMQQMQQEQQEQWEKKRLRRRARQEKNASDATNGEDCEDGSPVPVCKQSSDSNDDYGDDCVPIMNSRTSPMSSMLRNMDQIMSPEPCNVAPVADAVEDEAAINDFFCGDIEAASAEDSMLTGCGNFLPTIQCPFLWSAGMQSRLHEEDANVKLKAKLHAMANNSIAEYESLLSCWTQGVLSILPQMDYFFAIIVKKIDDMNLISMDVINAIFICKMLLENIAANKHYFEVTFECDGNVSVWKLLEADSVLWDNAVSAVNKAVHMIAEYQTTYFTFLGSTSQTLMGASEGAFSGRSSRATTNAPLNNTAYPYMDSYNVYNSRSRAGSIGEPPPIAPNGVTTPTNGRENRLKMTIETENSPYMVLSSIQDVSEEWGGGGTGVAAGVVPQTKNQNNLAASTPGASKFGSNYQLMLGKLTVKMKNFDVAHRQLCAAVATTLPGCVVSCFFGVRLSTKNSAISAAQSPFSPGMEQQDRRRWSSPRAKFCSPHIDLHSFQRVLIVWLSHSLNNPLWLDRRSIARKYLFDAFMYSCDSLWMQYECDREESKPFASGDESTFADNYQLGDVLSPTMTSPVGPSGASFEDNDAQFAVGELSSGPGKCLDSAKKTSPKPKGLFPIPLIRQSVALYLSTMRGVVSCIDVLVNIFSNSALAGSSSSMKIKASGGGMGVSAGLSSGGGFSKMESVEYLEKLLLCANVLMTLLQSIFDGSSGSYYVYQKMVFLEQKQFLVSAVELFSGKLANVESALPVILSYCSPNGVSTSMKSNTAGGFGSSSLPRNGIDTAVAADGTAVKLFGGASGVTSPSSSVPTASATPATTTHEQSASKSDASVPVCEPEPADSSSADEFSDWDDDECDEANNESTASALNTSINSATHGGNPMNNASFSLGSNMLGSSANRNGMSFSTGMGMVFNGSGGPNDLISPENPARPLLSAYSTAILSSSKGVKFYRSMYTPGVASWTGLDPATAASGVANRGEAFMDLLKSLRDVICDVSASILAQA